MVDMFPFPRVISNTPEEQIAELLNYLIQFKETLEFALNNISTENLSPDLVNRLNELGADIKQSHVEREDELTQISNNALTISDVCNSQLFQDEVAKEVEEVAKELEAEVKKEVEEVAKELEAEVKKEVANKVTEEVSGITFNVNFNTGHLEYAIAE